MKSMMMSVVILFTLSNSSFANENRHSQTNQTNPYKENSVDRQIYLQTSHEIHSFLSKKFKQRMKRIDKKDDSILFSIDEEALPWISMLVHKEFKQCGGYITHTDQKLAKEEFLIDRHSNYAEMLKDFNLYQINQPTAVNQLIDTVQESTIKDVIVELSNFHNRYYDVQSGVDSQEYVKNRWQEILNSRTDTKVEFYNHSGWMQPSVIAEIRGSKKPYEYIVIGGHGDSIAGFWSRSRARAPGADDNASGIGTMTEIMRSLVENNYVPDRTILFMSYAAEEVGLLGSNEIATEFRQSGKNVVGAIQLDMVNFKGADEDIVLITDNTNAEQNNFLGRILDTYFPDYKWENDQCGYACSDHASWHKQGFSVSMPFEAKKRSMNGSIHTRNDTISESGNNADHAVKFAKLTLAYIAEIDK